MIAEIILLLAIVGVLAIIGLAAWTLTVLAGAPTDEI